MNDLMTQAISRPIALDEFDQTRIQAGLDDFHNQGFAHFQRMSDAPEVAEIRKTLSALLAAEAGAKDGKLFDTMASPNEIKARRSLQLTNPAKFAPELLKSAYVQRATEIAKQILSPDCVLRMDFALVKYAHVGTGTPWHQDEAYRDSRYRHHEITFWLPLQDVGIDDGCMIFIPGSHVEGVYEHRSFNGDASKHVIECATGQFAEDKALACPMEAGDCSVHHQRTLHCTKNNTSGVDRYAYILVFGMADTPATGSELFPWLAAREAAKVRAKRAWLLRGGALPLLWHKLKRGDLRDRKDIWPAVKRAVRNLRGGR